jgi:hypothetical protein
MAEKGVILGRKRYLKMGTFFFFFVIFFYVSGECYNEVYGTDPVSTGLISNLVL